ncbi:triose-phosphate isomerase [Mycoplasma mycoides]|uniref:Triosephosphate isomerase n=1 Tax=Mycoplasma mycoides subsp. capri LC str. 95010 TaxID=862259 RepID=F4MQU1_MYCML|nr:triose-phosphate isomerase [Mycoplasma mycoides]QVK06663.1 triose-phosphate isomerase [Mycoplasma mycoides subsp. capri]CBW54474.1 Triosephosphate isomerase [Mycoplasma mycoides subsp. capri LC str. 95010]
MKKKVIFGNWKMNGTNESLTDFLNQVDNKIDSSKIIAGLAVPYVMLQTGLKLAKNVKIAAQNVHYKDKGAYTGEISTTMLKEIGVEYVIIGHSERREMFNETDLDVNKKAKVLLENNITPIICCGETLQTKESGKTIEFVNNQINIMFEGIKKEEAIKAIIAYEPIWAIGTGKTATSSDAEEVCKQIRNNLTKIYDKDTAEQIIIQYGGSVKPSNIQEYLKMPNIDGALVGGASLLANDYLGLVNYNE